MDKIDVFCLDAVADDYENALSVRARLAGEGFEERAMENISFRLCRLAREGLVDAFLFNPGTEKFEPTIPAENTADRLCFLLNNRGLNARDEHWDPAWDSL